MAIKHEVGALKRLGKLFGHESCAEYGNEALATAVRIPVDQEHSDALEKLTGWDAAQLWGMNDDQVDGARAVIAFDFGTVDGDFHCAWIEETRCGGYSLRLRDDSEAGDWPWSYGAGEFRDVFRELVERMHRQEMEGCDECGRFPACSDGPCYATARVDPPSDMDEDGFDIPVVHRDPEPTPLSIVFQGIALTSAMVLALTLS